MKYERFNTLELAQAAIAQFDELFGYPDGKGTETYTLPELVEVKDEEGEVIDSYYNVLITNELEELLNEESLDKSTEG